MSFSLARQATLGLTRPVIKSNLPSVRHFFFFFFCASRLSYHRYTILTLISVFNVVQVPLAIARSFASEAPAKNTKTFQIYRWVRNFFFFFSTRMNNLDPLAHFMDHKVTVDIGWVDLGSGFECAGWMMLKHGFLIGVFALCVSDVAGLPLLPVDSSDCQIGGSIVRSDQATENNHANSTR